MSIQECSMNVSTIRLVVESERHRSLLLSFELAAQGPVGTRGGVEWMRGPCACPRWGCDLGAPRSCHHDKHQAPPYPTSAPCPYITPFSRQHSSGTIHLAKHTDGSRRRADHAPSPAKCVWRGPVPRQCGQPLSG
jgi:hypothetical protein